MPLKPSLAPLYTYLTTAGRQRLVRCPSVLLLTAAAGWWRRLSDDREPAHVDYVAVLCWHRLSVRSVRLLSTNKYQYKYQYFTCPSFRPAHSAKVREPAHSAAPQLDERRRRQQVPAAGADSVARGAAALFGRQSVDGVLPVVAVAGHQPAHDLLRVIIRVMDPVDGLCDDEPVPGLGVAERRLQTTKLFHDTLVILPALHTYTVRQTPTQSSTLLLQRLVAWLSGRTSVSGRRTFPVLRSTCS